LVTCILFIGLLIHTHAHCSVAISAQNYFLSSFIADLHIYRLRLLLSSFNTILFCPIQMSVCLIPSACIIRCLTHSPSYLHSLSLKSHMLRI